MASPPPSLDKLQKVGGVDIMRCSTVALGQGARLQRQRRNDEKENGAAPSRARRAPRALR